MIMTRSSFCMLDMNWFHKRHFNIRGLAEHEDCESVYCALEEHGGIIPTWRGPRAKSPVQGGNLEPGLCLFLRQIGKC